MRRKIKFIALSIALTPSVFMGMASCVAAQSYTVTVTAGAFDRQGSVVSFTLPGDVAPGVYRMESEGGNSINLQIDRQNRGWFILEELEAGSSRAYHLDTESSLQPPSGTGGVTHSISQNRIEFYSEGNTVFSYYHGQNELPSGMNEVYRRGGYIHPLFSPSGVPLTNHLDPEMHTHHYGVWSAWTNTEFQGRTPDFWNVQDRTARVDHADSLEAAWEGPVHGGFRALNHFVDLSGSAPVIALNEQWEVMVYDTPSGSDYLMFDLVVTHTTNTAQPLVLPKYHYGGMAFRGHENWNNPENITFLTSEGFDRSSGNETRARWSHMGGIVDGNRAGIAVLGHPGNFRAPQPVRINSGSPYFVYAPMQLGEMSIEPGSPYVMRYRYVTYDGEPDPEQLDRLWNDYAYPPGVTVSVQ